MIERLKIMEERYKHINDLLLDPEIVKDVKKMTSLMKEMRSLEKPVEKYHLYADITNQIIDLKELAKDNDPEIREMALMELDEKETQIETLTEELKILLIPKDPNDDKNVICEIRGAAGGDEANIFAGDLFRLRRRSSFPRSFRPPPPSS